MENAMSEGELLPCPALPKRRVCIPHPHEPDKRVVGFVIEQADEAWGELGISEPLFWLDRILATLSPPAQSNASAEAKPTHWHNGMGQVLTDVQKVVADSEDGVYASRFSDQYRANVAMHCTKDGPQPIPLYVHPSQPEAAGLREALTKDQWFVLEWLAKEDFSHLGECHGPDLNALVDAGLAVINGRRVSVTDAGFWVLKLRAALNPKGKAE